MNAKEKAHDIYGKYRSFQLPMFAKKSASLAVDEVLQQLVWMHAAANTAFMRTFISDQNDYWKEVKEEIEKL